ncbi:MAG: uroporphyrinogen-III synthase [Planctomycetaceae bacterium]|nr:uroporphyrinogen-III synthase [Planctomycetaceae bacterium]
MIEQHKQISSGRVLQVCSFESRRAEEMAALIRKQGGEAVIAPSMQEVNRDDHSEVFAFADDLLSGRIDMVIFLTGVGATALLEIAETQHSRDDLLAAINRCITVVRGPKPTAVLNQWKVHVDYRAPEPNTWRELLATLDAAEMDLSGKHVAVQEYGELSNELHAGLVERGAIVKSVPVYRWTLPDDVGPLESAIRKTCEGAFDVLLFTSAQQVRHVLQVAERLGLQDEWRAATETCVIGSIGPTCSEAIREVGLTVDFEPSHPKMGVLVREVLAEAPSLLSAKRK